MTRERTDWTGVAFGVWLGVLAAYHQFKVPAALPTLIAAYGYPSAVSGGAMSVYAVAGVLLASRLGAAIQRIGLARFVLLALGLTAGGSLVSLAAPQAGWVMVAGRGLEGVGFIVLAIACASVANAHTAPRHMPVTAALVALWVPVGQLMANGVAAAALPVAGWMPVWWTGIAASLATAALAVLLGRRGRIDLDGRGPGSAAQVPLAAAERRALRWVAAVFMLWSVQLLAFQTWMPQYLVAVRGYDIAAALALFSLPVAVILAGNLVGGAILRAGVPLAVLLAAVLGVQAAFWLLLPVAHGLFGGAVLCVYALAVGITPTCLYAAPPALVGPLRAGAAAAATLQVGRSLGVLAGPLLFAWLVQALAGWDAAGVPMAAVAAAGVAATLRFAALHRRLHAARPPVQGSSL